MPARELTDEDHELIETATETLAEHFEPGRHEVASALRTGSGEVYTAINLVPGVGTAAVHCEPITIGMAIMDGEAEFEASVAVTYADRDPDGEVVVVSACGVCRELMADFDPDTWVFLPGDDGPAKVPVSELLPKRA